MKGLIFGLCISTVVFIGANKEISDLLQGFTAPEARADSDSPDLRSSIRTIRDYARGIDAETGRSPDNYACRCLNCSELFDVPDLCGRCPNCASTNLKRKPKVPTAKIIKQAYWDLD